MKKLVIITEDKHLDKVRNRASKIIDGHEALTTPLSETGEEPATHWICVCTVDDELLKKIKKAKKNSLIYEDKYPKQVLNELKLKRINDK